jgi:hypothetical protein
VRFGPALVGRVQRGEELGSIAGGASLTLVGGAGLYGAVFGGWRAPEQALIVATKLPLVLLAVVAVASLAGAFLASSLRTGLDLARTATLLLVGLATTSALLGALAPVAALFVLHAPPPDPVALGLAHGDPAARATVGVHHGLLLGHIAVIAVCGVVGVSRLRGTLRAVVDAPSQARAVWWAWALLCGFVGAEISWLARPFQGSPVLPPGWFRSEPLDGNFFESVWRMLQAVF